MFWILILFRYIVNKGFFSLIELYINHTCISHIYTYEVFEYFNLSKYKTISFKGIFTIRLPKETPGQHFEGLNMLTALLAPRKSRSAKPLVEEIGMFTIVGSK